MNDSRRKGCRQQIVWELPWTGMNLLLGGAP